MPGKGHSGRFRSSISNRSDKPAFRVLAPWNSRKNGQKGQVAISQGSDTVKFAKLDAQQMANYNAGTFTMNNNFTVAGGTTLNETVTVNATINQSGASTTNVGFLNVANTATYNQDLFVGQNLVVGNDFTVNGTTTTINTKIVDISDSIIKVNDVYCDQDGNKSHGILFEYNTEHETGVTGNFQPTNGFFGVQRKIGPDINTHTLGAANTGGGSGVFTYYTKDISDNVSGALLTDGSFNIPTAFLGDALFNNLDLCGNLTGYNTFQIKNGDSGTDGTIWMRANDISMNAVNNISALAQDEINLAANGWMSLHGGGGGVGGLLISGQGSSNISVLGDSQSLTLAAVGDFFSQVIVNSAGAGADAIKLDASGGIDIDAGTNVTMDSGGTTTITGGTGTTVTTTAGTLTLDGATGVDISGNAGAVNITTTGTVDINAGPLDIDADGALTIDSGTSIAIGTTQDKLIDIDASTLDIDASDKITITSTANVADAITVETTVGGIDIKASGASAGEDINIAATGSSVNITSTEADAAAIVLSASNASGGIVVGAGTSGVNLDATGEVNIASSKDGASAVVLTASAGGVDITATGAGGGEDINITATGSSVNITSTEDVANAIKVEATAGGVDIDAAAAFDVDIAGGQVKLSNKEDIEKAISLTTNAGSNETIEVTNNLGNDLNAITMCAKAGGIIIDAFTGVRIGTETAPANCPTSAVIIGGTTTSTVFNGDISANGNIDAAGQTATFDTVVTNTLNLLNNFTIGTIGSNTNNFILFGAGGVIGNGIMTAVPGSAPIQLLQSELGSKHAINLREDLTWISNKDGNNSYPGFDENDPAVLKGGSLVVDGNMLFGAARGRTGWYDQGADNNVNYGSTG